MPSKQFLGTNTLIVLRIVIARELAALYAWLIVLGMAVTVLLAILASLV